MPDLLDPCPEDVAYPPQLRGLETAAIATRRQHAASSNAIPNGNSFLPVAPTRESTSWRDDGIGLALSGGGIRSATFSLGVLQAMAETNFLRLVDFMSTVSGGSFIGAFLGRHYLRGDEFNAYLDSMKSPPAADVQQNDRVDDGEAARGRPHPHMPDVVEQHIADRKSRSVYWLRQNGRYLAPRGGGDVAVAAAGALRDWLTLQVFVGVFVLAVLLGVQLVRIACVAGGNPWTAKISIPSLLLAPKHAAYPLPWYARALEFMGWPLVIVLALFLAVGVIYWLMVYIVHYWLLIRDKDRLIGRPARWRRALTDFSSYILVTAAVLAFFRFIDRAGLEIYLSEGRIIPTSLATIGASISAALGVAGRFFPDLVVPNKEKPTNWGKLLRPLATAAGLLLFTGFMLLLSVLAHGLTSIANVDENVVTVNGANAAIGLAVFAGLALWWGRLVGIVDLTTFHKLYAARLARAYLGASNPARWTADGKGVTDPVEGDNIPLTNYMPHKKGGPIHIINATLNETVSGESQLEYRDRKGLPVALSSIAMSVGVSHHATIPCSTCVDRMTLTRCGVDETESNKQSQSNKAPKRFHMFLPEVVNAEALSLAEWVAISGAAVSTGLGSLTSMGLSMVLTFFNVRLGCWWDSGINPLKRVRTPATGAKKLVALTDRLFGLCFTSYSYLLSEFLGRFHGPGRQRWNLTDGGHFENTGVYELIRRRLPLIICLDNGADPDYELSDLGNLVRRARTDFGASIRFINFDNARVAGASLQAKIINHITDIHQAGNRFFGRPGELTRSWKRTDAKAHAAVATIDYDGSGASGVLIWVKPSLTGDETSDVRQYSVQCPPFPQQTTADQFFDEAQWESYRELGYHIGNELMQHMHEALNVQGEPDEEARARPKVKSKAKATAKTKVKANAKAKPTPGRRR